MPRVPDQYVWLVWSGTFLVAWAGFFAAFPRLRAALWWVSACTAPFGLTEFLFLGDYWNPPSVLTLGAIIHLPADPLLDIESFLFCFGIGGVAAVLFNVVFAKPLRFQTNTVQCAGHREGYVGAFLLPFLLYLPLTGWLARPLWTGIGLMFAGALARVVLFPGLRTKTLMGGVLFGAYYALFLVFLCWIAPGYISRTWVRTIPGGHALGIPWAELCFGLAVGMFWSGIYEQVVWIFTPVRIVSGARRIRAQ